MDSIFRLEYRVRAAYLQHLTRTIGSAYICIWSFLPQPTNCLIPLAGFYKDESIQLGAANASAGTSLGRRLFDDYRQFLFSMENDQVPGFAFKNGIPFVELEDAELQRLVFNEAQTQFYQEAKIKSVVLMGCKDGEIELGFSNNQPPVNLETELKNWFPEDFLQQSPPVPLDQTRPSSSESSWHSLSIDSPECSPFLFTMPNAPLVIDPTNEGAQIFEPMLRPATTTTPNTLSPLHQAIMQPYGNNPQLFPTSSVSENEVMNKAMLAVLSASSSPPNSSTSSRPRNMGIHYPLSQNDTDSAFKSFGSGTGSGPLLGATGRVSVKRQNMVKKSIRFYQALNSMRISQERVQGTRPSTTQMHHTISERKRREKLNESFETLRTLLPPGTKKDKASVLRSTVECLASLRAQVADLTEKLQHLEAQLSPERDSRVDRIRMPSNERLHVHITNLPESTSQGRIADLHVLVRGEFNNLDLVIRVLEFLKQLEIVEVISVDADTEADESNPVTRVVLRLKIEGDEWDESAFQEAVGRVVADLAR